MKVKCCFNALPGVGDPFQLVQFVTFKIYIHSSSVPTSSKALVFVSSGSLLLSSDNGGTLDSGTFVSHFTLHNTREHVYLWILYKTHFHTFISKQGSPPQFLPTCIFNTTGSTILPPPPPLEPAKSLVPAPEWIPVKFGSHVR